MLPITTLHISATCTLIKLGITYFCRLLPIFRDCNLTSYGNYDGNELVIN